MFKEIKYILILLIFTNVILLPICFSVGVPDYDINKNLPAGGSAINPTGIKSPISDAPGVVNILIIILRWTYTIFFVISAFMVILAAFTYLTAGAEPEKIKSANHKIIYAAIAIAVALLAVSINAIVGSIIGPSGGGGGGGTSGQTSPSYDLGTGGGLQYNSPVPKSNPSLNQGDNLGTSNLNYNLREGTKF